mmetsp:Transcript_13576/g.20659  ORF Transcript_13576/g.20659 Transcript_13576/m.20659 type:complete len:396 (+) Transcript_13576:7-1194(+)
MGVLQKLSARSNRRRYNNLSPDSKQRQKKPGFLLGRYKKKKQNDDVPDLTLEQPTWPESEAEESPMAQSPNVMGLPSSEAITEPPIMKRSVPTEHKREASKFDFPATITVQQKSKKKRTKMDKSQRIVLEQEMTTKIEEEAENRTVSDQTVGIRNRHQYDSKKNMVILLGTCGTVLIATAFLFLGYTCLLTGATLFRSSLPDDNDHSTSSSEFAHYQYTAVIRFQNGREPLLWSTSPDDNHKNNWKKVQLWNDHYEETSFYQVHSFLLDELMPRYNNKNAIQYDDEEGRLVIQPSNTIQSISLLLHQWENPISSFTTKHSECLAYWQFPKSRNRVQYKYVISPHLDQADNDLNAQTGCWNYKAVDDEYHNDYRRNWLAGTNDGPVDEYEIKSAEL